MSLLWRSENGHPVLESFTKLFSSGFVPDVLLPLHRIARRTSHDDFYLPFAIFIIMPAWSQCDNSLVEFYTYSPAHTNYHCLARKNILSAFIMLHQILSNLLETLFDPTKDSSVAHLAFSFSLLSNSSLSVTSSNSSSILGFCSSSSSSIANRLS